MAKPIDPRITYLRDTSRSNDDKIKCINDVKSTIKHHVVSEEAAPSMFEFVRTAISSQHSSIVVAGFSTLNHLLKRLNIQEQPKLIAAQSGRTLPLLIERLGDPKERYRLCAAQALADFWTVSQLDVEREIRDSALAGKNQRAKEAGMHWLSKMCSEQGLQFRGFVPRLMDCLEDADGGVREAAKTTVVTIFRNAPEHAKSDLKRQMQIRGVRKAIATSILVDLGLSAPIDPDTKTTTSAIEPPKQQDSLAGGTGNEPLPVPDVSTVIEHEGERLEPAYVNSQRELDDTFRDMAPWFEGKESEQNWTAREKSIIKLRQLTKGNAPADYFTAYVAGIKGLLDGILKTVNSLRTTVSMNGCRLVQDVARVLGPGLDSMVEILLQNLIKLCAGTKKISAQNGNLTVDAIFAHVSYNLRLMQHLWGACQDKNVQPRTFAAGWLQTILANQAHHKGQFDHSGGLDLAEKCIKKGLADANPGVRENMRGTYWSFAKIWPERAEGIMSSLDGTSQKLLEKDSRNPNTIKKPETAPASSVRPTPVARGNSALANRPSLKETIAAQKRAKLAAKGLPDRPGSAQSSFSPVKHAAPSGSKGSSAVSSAMASGSLMSAPVRPMRPARRPELTRPATADPYASRRPLKADTPGISPAVSPSKTKSKATSATTSMKTKMARTGSPTPEKSKSKGPPTSGIISIEGAAPNADGYSTSSPTKDDEQLTMVLPKINKSKDEVESRPTTSGKDVSLRSASPVKVYEDPQPHGDHEISPVQHKRTKALEELPINEPANTIPPLINEGTIGEKKPEAVDKISGTDEQYQDEQNARRLLTSGISKAKARTLDVHALRKLQTTLKGHPTVWENSSHFGELLLPLLSYLQNPNEDARVTPKKSQDLQTQVLHTIRIMLDTNQEFFSAFYDQALCAVLLARKHWDSTSYFAALLQSTAEQLIKLGNTTSCFSSVLDLMKSEEQGEVPSRMAIMCLQTIARLIQKVGTEDESLSGDKIERSGSLIGSCLDDPDPDVRRSAVECCVELYNYLLPAEGEIEREKAFWEMVPGAKEHHRNLVAYYFAKRNEVSSA
ncbi:MAG: hypothetical protein M1819_004674 [Sarea resinae]|nr:MAG: hypothetical protein M1819_004674 [Sarea resinae]